MHRFMEESEHGVIFFALGATFKPGDIPQHQIKAFLNAFGRLPQRVLIRMQGGNSVPYILAKKRHGNQIKDTKDTLPGKLY